MFRRSLITGLAAATVLLGSAGVGQAATHKSKPGPSQEQERCMVKTSVDLLKAIDKQTWKNRAARDEALKAIPGKVKDACGTTTPPPSNDPHAGLQSYQVSSASATVAPGKTRRFTVRCDADDFVSLFFFDTTSANYSSGASSIVGTNGYFADVTNADTAPASFTMMAICEQGPNPNA
jgi:hypothetical protein